MHQFGYITYYGTIPKVIQALDSSQVGVHTFVIGELACGNLKARSPVIQLLQTLPRMMTATDYEVLFFIERHKLMGRGIGYIDTHLLAATAIHGTAQLWTRDKRLQEIAAVLGIAYLERTH